MDNAGLDRGEESKRSTNFNRKNTNTQNQTIGYLGNTKEKTSSHCGKKRKSRRHEGRLSIVKGTGN